MPGHRLPPWAACGYFSWGATTAGWGRKHESTQSESPASFPCAPTTTSLSEDFVCPHWVRTGRQWILRPTCGEDSRSFSVPTDLGKTPASTQGTTGMVASLPIQSGQPLYGDSLCGEYLTLNISICLAGFARVLGQKRFRSSVGVLRASDTNALCWVCAGIPGEKGLELVHHFPSGCVAKINIP
jgi:hypothetical protein